MATTQTTRTMTRIEARAWLDNRGFIATRLPRKDETLEMVDVDYSQYDLTRDGSTFTLVSTRLVPALPLHRA